MNDSPFLSVDIVDLRKEFVLFGRPKLILSQAALCPLPACIFGIPSTRDATARRAAVSAMYVRVYVGVTQA